jgi:hypothetical protein
LSDAVKDWLAVLALLVAARGYVLEYLSRELLGIKT